MCGLCGLLGEDRHWSSLPTNGQSSNAVLRRLARSRRIAIVNRMLDARRVRVSDWQGSQYLVSTATGKTLLAMNLPDIWRAVAELTGSPFDPLGQEGLSRQLRRSDEAGGYPIHGPVSEPSASERAGP